MTTAGGPAALRGYRLQSLYALQRILKNDCVSDSIQYRLEGAEDLELVEVASGSVVEYVQVKAYSSPLALSHLVPTAERSEESSAIHRALARIGRGDRAVQKIVCVGCIGPELRDAWASEGAARESVRKKLTKLYSNSEVDSLFQDLTFEEQNEKDLERDTLECLSTGLAGGEPAVSFELLSFWIHCRSEAEAVITGADVRARIAAVGKYLAARATHHKEWFTSILPLVSDATLTKDPDRLEREFYQGVSARFEHIVADLDVVREERLGAIARAFEHESVVIVHGPSGQGKSALAYRFLCDYVPETLRFEVRTIEGLRHAQSIARALLGHSSSIGVPMYVYLDVQPRDKSWIEAVERLSANKTIRVLVTVREEDWAQAGQLRYRLPYEEVVLSLDREEAEGVFNSLVERGASTKVLDFEDAWSRFSPPGPLLEFVFLVVQDSNLGARLKEQVHALESELSPAEMELLRVFAVVTAFGANLKLKEAVKLVGLQKAPKTLRRLEGEYLLRPTPDGKFLEALHPIRSELLAKLLTDAELHPRADTARGAMPLVPEPDLELFGLHLLARHWDSAASSADALLELDPVSATGVAAVLQLLLWFAVRKHLDDCGELLENAHEEFGDAATLLLNWDVAGLMGHYPELRVRLEDMEFLPEAARSAIARLRPDANTERADFELVVNWLKQGHELGEMHQPTDWSGLASLAFWAGFLGVGSQDYAWISQARLGTEFDNLGLEVASDVLFGLSFLQEDVSYAGFESARLRTISRFRDELNIVAIEDDGQAICAHFMMTYEGPPQEGTSEELTTSESGATPHQEAMRRIDLLRRLFPGHEYFGCRGYGHTLPGLDLPFDDTKKGRIPAHSLPPPWPTKLNAIFRHLTQYSHRPAGWNEHAVAVLDARVSALTCLREMRKAVGEFCSSGVATQPFDGEIDPTNWDRVRGILRSHPRLPRTAVDEWGFVGEGLGNQSSPQGEGRITEPLAISRHEAYLGTLRGFLSPLSNYFDQAVLVLIANPVLGRAGSEKLRRQIRGKLEGRDLANTCKLSIHNLLEAVTALRAFQVGFRDHLGGHVDVTALSELEERERTEMKRSWAMWCQFAATPKRRFADVEKQAPVLLEQARRKQMKKLEKRLRKLQSKGIVAEVLSESEEWEGSSALWISCDVKYAPDILSCWWSVLTTTARALRPGNSELLRGCLSMHWKTVLVVPLVGGRSVGSTAYKIGSIHFIWEIKQEGFGWWNLVQHAIPFDSCARLGISSWEGLHGFDSTKALGVSVLDLFSHLAYLQCIDELPERDERGGAILTALVRDFGDALSDALNEIGNGVTAVSSEFFDLTEGEKAQRPLLQEALCHLNEAMTGLYPEEDMQSEFTLSQEEISAWFERLAGVMENIELMRLLLVADLIDNQPGSTR